MFIQHIHFYNTQDRRNSLHLFGYFKLLKINNKQVILMDFVYTLNIPPVYIRYIFIYNILQVYINHIQTVWKYRIVACFGIALNRIVIYN